MEHFVSASLCASVLAKLVATERFLQKKDIISDTTLIVDGVLYGFTVRKNRSVNTSFWETIDNAQSYISSPL